MRQGEPVRMACNLFRRSERIQLAIQAIRVMTESPIEFFNCFHVEKLGLCFKLARYLDGLTLIRLGFLLSVELINGPGRIPQDEIGTALDDHAGNDHGLGCRLVRLGVPDCCMSGFC